MHWISRNLAVEKLFNLFRRVDAEMKFRNYFPRDSDLQKSKHPPPVVPKFEDPVATDPLQVVGAEVLYKNANLFLCSSARSLLWKHLMIFLS